jgi:hypothetical protein
MLELAITFFYYSDLPKAIRFYEEKPVQLCIRMPDVDAWHAYLSALDIESLGDVFTSEKLGIRAFVFDDPEGYQIKVQLALI